VSEYFNNNFYVTTSGHSHTRTLFNTISEIGVDRVMFSVDYPYETMEEAAGWVRHLAAGAQRLGEGRQGKRPAPVRGMTTPAIVRSVRRIPQGCPGRRATQVRRAGNRVVSADDGAIMTESILGAGIIGVSRSGARPAPLASLHCVLPNYEIRTRRAQPMMARIRRSARCQRMSVTAQRSPATNSWRWPPM
jgi:hypothetical protein